MTTTPRGALHPLQVRQLSRPIMTSRVMHANGHSHLSQQDVVAHLIRIFGFGNFDTEILDLSLLYEDRQPNPKKPETWRYEVSYKAVVRLTIRNMDGEVVATYEDVSTGTAKGQPSRGDAHDLASKSAVSLAKKRCAIHLGDQFGLSLYNKGQTAPLVLPTGPDLVTVIQTSGDVSDDTDMQTGVPEQVDLGNVDPESDHAPAPVVDDDQIQKNLNRAGGQS